jgi:cell division inhibitor SulA
VTNIARVIKTQSTTQQPVSGVTELVLASDSPEQLTLLLPMIAFLGNSCKDRLPG